VTKNNKQAWEINNELVQPVDIIVAEYIRAEESTEIPRYLEFGNNFVGAFLYRISQDVAAIAQFLPSLPAKLKGFNPME
jgi:hypothetical protein